MRARTMICLMVLTVWGSSADALARPERIRAGHSYYSDSAAAKGLVCDTVGDLNYEEVYQLYRYFEVVYDESERVIRFVTFVRGEATQVETYSYGADGRLAQRVVERAGQPPLVTTPDPSGGDGSDGTEPGDCPSAV